MNIYIVLRLVTYHGDVRTHGVDFSWLASIVFGGSAYWLLSRSEPHPVSGA